MTEEETETTVDQLAEAQQTIEWWLDRNPDGILQLDMLLPVREHRGGQVIQADHVPQEAVVDLMEIILEVKDTLRGFIDDKNYGAATEAIQAAIERVGSIHRHLPRSDERQYHQIGRMYYWLANMNHGLNALKGWRQ